MGKVILVLDAQPSACISCPLFCASEKCCGYWQHAADEEDIFEKRPDWCPLKETPERLNTSYPTAYEKIVTLEAMEIYRTGFENGFNECLHQILGKEY